MRHSAIRLYVDPERRIAGLKLIPLLAPYFESDIGDGAPFTAAAKRQYVWDKDLYQLTTSLKNADYVVLPHHYTVLAKRHPLVLGAIIADAKRAGKLLLIDGSGDIEIAAPPEDAVVLRIGQYRFLKQANEITIPVHVEDLLESYAGGVLRVREKQPVPIVGFAGWAQLEPHQYVRSLLKELPLRARALFDKRYRACSKGVFFRAKAVKALRASKRVRTNFLVRKTFSGHTATMQGDPDVLRRQYVENFQMSDYALSVRGDANADGRLYEAMSLGKIPLIVDTARVLPLEHLIPYRDFCVFVDYTEIDRLGDILADFHASVSSERFVEMQQMSRYYFEHFLRVDGFSKQLALMLRHKADSYYGRED